MPTSAAARLASDYGRAFGIATRVTTRPVERQRPAWFTQDLLSHLDDRRLVFRATISVQQQQSSLRWRRLFAAGDLLYCQCARPTDWHAGRRHSRSHEAREAERVRHVLD